MEVIKLMSGKSRSENSAFLGEGILGGQTTGFFAPLLALWPRGVYSRFPSNFVHT